MKDGGEDAEGNGCDEMRREPSLSTSSPYPSETGGRSPLRDRLSLSLRVAIA